MQLDRIGSLFAGRALLRTGVVPQKPAASVLMYHSVSDEPEPGVSAYYRLVTSPARFREQMRWLRDGDYSVVDLAEVIRRVESGSPAASRSVVLTFDDGFRDFLIHAQPVLAEFGFTATVFLPSAFIGADRKAFKGRDCLTWSEVRELHARGVSFGSHTVTHPRLHGLSWADVRRELGDSRAHIEDALQSSVTTFAYPYAFPQEDRGFTTRFRDELRACGYSAAVTTVIGRVRERNDPLCLKRLPVNDCDDRPLFTSKLSGAYDWVGKLQSLYRRAKRPLTSSIRVSCPT